MWKSFHQKSMSILMKCFKSLPDKGSRSKKLFHEVLRDRDEGLFAKSSETKNECLQNYERAMINVCKIITTSWQWEHLIATSGSNMQRSVAVVVDDVRVRSGPQDHCQGVLWTTLIFFLVASFADNNCLEDNFFIFFPSCRFTTLLVLLWTPCSCQRPRCGRRCCPPRLERLLPLPGIVYEGSTKK